MKFLNYHSKSDLEKTLAACSSGDTALPSNKSTFNELRAAVDYHLFERGIEPYSPHPVAQRVLEVLFPLEYGAHSDPLSKSVLKQAAGTADKTQLTTAIVLCKGFTDVFMRQPPIPVHSNRAVSEPLAQPAFV